MERPFPLTAAPRPMPLLSVVFMGSRKQGRRPLQGRQPVTRIAEDPAGEPRLLTQPGCHECGKPLLECGRDRAERPPEGCDHQERRRTPLRVEVVRDPALEGRSGAADAQPYAAGGEVVGRSSECKTAAREDPQP